MQKKIYSLSIAIFYIVIAATPVVAGHLKFVEIQKNSVNGVEGLLSANTVTVSPDGNSVYATGLNDDSIAVFNRDATSGQLTFVEYHRDGVNGVDGLDGTNSVTVSPDGKNVYATGSYDDAIAVFSRNATSGQLTFLEYHKDGVNGVDGLLSAKSATVSPDGKSVYAIGGHDDAVAVFSRDATSGQLTFLEYHKDGVNGVDGLGYASSVTVSPDGKNVYTAALSDSAVSVFSRDATSGQLTFVEYHKNGFNGVAGLSGAFSVTVSPDGENVYAVGSGDAVAVFSRDLTSGQLTFLEYHRDGVNGVDGLDWAHSVIVSPDGKNVYVASFNDDAVCVFSRDATSGQLAFVQYQKDGVNGVDGLNAASGVTISLDGNHVYVASVEDNAVAVFRISRHNLDSLNVFGMEEGNQWIYNDGITETVEELDPASYYPREYWVKIYENNSWIGSRMYGITGEELKLWTYDGPGLPMGFAFDDGLAIAWHPITVGEEKSSSANEVNYPGSVTSNAKVMGYEEVQLGFDTFYAYKIRLIITVSGAAGTTTITMNNWFLPYIGFIKSEADGVESTLVSFAIDQGSITETSDGDNDDLLDYKELVNYSTDPYDSDSDDDGYTDGEEVNFHDTDPNDPYSHPSTAMPCIPLLLLDN